MTYLLLARWALLIAGVGVLVAGGAGFAILYDTFR